MPLATVGERRCVPRMDLSGARAGVPILMDKRTTRNGQSVVRMRV